MHPDRNVPFNFDNFPGGYAAMLDCSKLVNDALVLGRERSDYARNLPEGRCLSKFFKTRLAGDNERQQNVAVIFPWIPSQSASRRLDYIDASLLWVGEHNAVDGWHIDPLRQTSRVGHECPRLTDELVQEGGALASGLLAGDVQVRG